MAQFNAEIKLTVDERAALQSVKNLERRIKNTSFSVNLRVNNLERTLKNVQQIERAATSLKGVFRSISSPGTGALGDSFRVAAKEANEFFDVVKGGAKFGSTGFAKTTAGVREQGAAFKTLAANIATTEPRFKDYIQGAEQASNISFARQLKELQALQDLYQKGITGRGESNVQGQKAFEKLQKDLPNTKAGLLAVRGELERVQDLVDSKSIAGLGIAQNLLEVNKRIANIDKDRLATLGSINAKQIQIANTVNQNVKKSAEGRAGSGFLDFSRKADTQTAVDKSKRRQQDRLRRIGELEAKIIRDNAALRDKKDLNSYNTRQRRLKFLANKEKAATAKRNKLGENLALGAGFPLLFGAGPGGVAGGVGGALLGGDGFGLQILLSALGTRLDELGATAIETAKNLRDPLKSFDALNEKLYLFDRAGAANIKRLEELGRSEEALALIRAKIDDRIGTEGVQTFEKLDQASKEFNTVLSDLSIQLQLFVAGPLTEFLKGITEGVKDTSQFKGNNKRSNEILQRLSTNDANDFLKQIARARVSGGLIKGGSGFGNQDAVTKVIEDFEKRFPGPEKKPTKVERTPEQVLKDSQVALANAEKEAALKKQGIDLERQVSAFRRSNEETIYGFKEKVASIERQNIDLRRSVENQIFNQRQAIAKQESDNLRKQQQVEIDRQDLALSGSRTFTNAPGEDLANSLSDAVRQYVKTRAEGEADLQQKERNFTLETIQLEQKQKDFELQVQQKIDAIKRTITQYERSVTKYKLDTQISIDSIARATADYQLERTKERMRLEDDNAKRIRATDAAAEMVRSGNYGGAGGKYMQGNIGPTSTGPHFDIKRKDGSFFGRTALDEYVRVNGGPLSAGVTVPGGEFGASRSYGQHLGRDYAFGGQAALTLQGGAQFMGTQKTAHGDATAFMTPDGQVYQILHGTFVPPTQAERASAPTMPAALTTPEAPAAPGVTDVSALTAQSAQLNQALISSKQNMLEIEASAKALADDQAIKNLSDTIAQSIQSVQAPLDNLLQTQQARFEDEKSYARLLQEGIAPAVAKQTVEIERQVATQLQILDTLISRAELELASLQAKELETTELEKQLELLKAQRGIIEGKGQSAVSAAATNEDGKKIRDYMNQLRGELNDTDAMIVSLAQTVTSELGTAISDSITGLIDGTTTVEEAFGNMFANIGKAFIDMAAQMLAQKAVLALLGAFTGGKPSTPQIGGGGGGFGGFFAEGGYVTGPTNAIVGEGGQPEYVIPASKMDGAMQRYSAGARGEEVIDGTTGEPISGGGMGSAGGPISITTGPVMQFEGSNYVSQSEFTAGIKSAAQQGEARALRRLQMSASTRRRVGL